MKIFTKTELNQVKQIIKKAMPEADRLKLKEITNRLGKQLITPSAKERDQIFRKLMIEKIKQDKTYSHMFELAERKYEVVNEFIYNFHLDDYDFIK